MNWSGVNVLVTGADGFIGSHLAEKLVRLGVNVKALVQYNSFDSCGWLDDSYLQNDMEIIRGDIRDEYQMRSVIKDVDVVFHLAALISVPHSFSAPRSYIETNVLGTMNILQASLDADVSRVIHTSTSEVYGSALHTPMDEYHPIYPQSPYAASKVGADAVVKAFTATYGLPTVILRPFNTYGPRQSERAVIPTIIRQALDPKCDKIMLGDITPKRDLTFVGDTADAFLTVADSDRNIADGRTYNCGNQNSISVGDLAEKISIMTTNKPIGHEPARLRPKDSEVDELLADVTKIGELFWWAKTPLIVGLCKTVDWWRDRIDTVRNSREHIV